MVQLVGAEPDNESQPVPGETLYVFKRPWEDIQLLVRDATDTVMSVGIYADTLSFKPTLDGEVLLNEPFRSQDLSWWRQKSASGSCGASWYQYFQIHKLPDVGDNRSIALEDIGNSDTDDPNLAHALCGDALSPRACTRKALSLPLTAVTTHLLGCLESFSNWPRIQSHMPVAVAIITAPNQPVTAAMVNVSYMQ
jgi:hypothetical protein